MSGICEYNLINNMCDFTNPPPETTFLLDAGMYNSEFSVRGEKEQSCSIIILSF